MQDVFGGENNTETISMISVFLISLEHRSEIQTNISEWKFMLCLSQQN